MHRSINEFSSMTQRELSQLCRAVQPKISIVSHINKPREKNPTVCVMQRRLGMWCSSRSSLACTELFSTPNTTTRVGKGNTGKAFGEIVITALKPGKRKALQLGEALPADPAGTMVRKLAPLLRLGFFSAWFLFTKPDVQPRFSYEFLKCRDKYLPSKGFLLSKRVLSP